MRIGAAAWLLALAVPAAAQSSPTPTPTPHQLENISARARVLTDNRVLIGGFIIRGDEPMKVVVRAIGPSLRAGAAPLPGRLSDPTLELFREGNDTPQRSNNDWKDNQEAEISATGLAPTNDLESAIVATLPAGGYTAVLRGRNGTTGIAVVEIYNASGAITSKLENISARAFVQTGDDVLIGGLIAGRGDAANGTIRVVVRAIGPSLTNRGVDDAMADPMVELVDAEGTRVGFSDNAGDEQSLELQETGLAPPHPNEAGVVVTLPRGNYTAVVRGVNATSGTALVEAFDVPAPGAGR